MEIKNPCPASLANMPKSENGYYCSSCDKCVIDFRDKSIDEIKSTLKPSDCGIFLPHQLTDQKRYTGIRRYAFGLLVFLSTLGFNVKPLQAQTEPHVEPLEPDTIEPHDTTLMILGKVAPAMPDEIDIREYKKAKRKHKRQNALRTLNPFRRKQMMGKVLIEE